MVPPRAVLQGSPPSLGRAAVSPTSQPPSAQQYLCSKSAAGVPSALKALRSQNRGCPAHLLRLVRQKQVAMCKKWTCEQHQCVLKFKLCDNHVTLRDDCQLGAGCAHYSRHIHPGHSQSAHSRPAEVNVYRRSGAKYARLGKTACMAESRFEGTLRNSLTRVHRQSPWGSQSAGREGNNAPTK
eukprot:scaffold17231_cov32-Tisochrysis_lutea.AAC.3